MKNFRFVAMLAISLAISVTPLTLTAQTVDSLRTGTVTFPNSSTAEIEVKFYGLNFANTFFCVRYAIQGQPMNSFSPAFLGSSTNGTFSTKIHDLEPGKNYTYQPFALCVGVAGPVKIFTAPTIPPPDPCLGYGPFTLSSVPNATPGTHVYPTVVTDDNGCTAPATISVTVPDCPNNPSPTACITANKGVSTGCGTANLCRGPSFNLFPPVGVNTSGGHWYPGGSFGYSLSVTTTYNLYGTQQYRYIDGDNKVHIFWATFVDCLTGDGTNGISGDGSEKTGVEVYPNPASSYVNVKNAQAGDYEFSLINSAGQNVRQYSGNENSEIPINGFPAGEYYLQIFENGRLVTTEVIIIHD